MPQNTNVAQLASLAERLISSEDEALRNLERYLQDLVCQLQDLAIVIPLALTGDITLTTVDELRTVIVQQIQTVKLDIEQMNTTASDRDRTSNSTMEAIPALVQELEGLKRQSRQLEDKKRSLYTQLTQRAASSITSTVLSPTSRRSSRTGSRYESLTINTHAKPKSPAPATHFSQPQELSGAAFESPRLETPARSLFSPTPGDSDAATGFESPTAAAWGDFDTAAAEPIQSPSSAFGDFVGASSPTSAWSSRADGFEAFADEPKNAPASPSLLVFSPSESGAAAGEKLLSAATHFIGDDSISATAAPTAVESDSSLLSLDSMMDFYPPKPKESVPVFDVFALAEASTFSALDAGNDIDVNVLEVVPDFAPSVQEPITPTATEPPNGKPPQVVETTRSSLSSVQLQSPVASAPRASFDAPSLNEPPVTAPVSSGTDFGTFEAFSASFNAAPAEASSDSGDFAFPSFDSTQSSHDPATTEWAATSFGDFSAATGDKSIADASKTGFGEFEAAFESPPAADDGFEQFGAFEASEQSSQSSWGNFDAFQSKDDIPSVDNGFGTFGDFGSAERSATVDPSGVSSGSAVNGLNNVQDQLPASITDLSGDFGYFSESRTASDADRLPVIGNFDSSLDNPVTTRDDQESFGVFSDSRTTSRSDLPVTNELFVEQPVFGAFDSFSKQTPDSSSSFGFGDFAPTRSGELTSPPSQSYLTEVVLEQPTGSFGESSTNDFGSFGDFNESSDSSASAGSFPSFSDDFQSAQRANSGHEVSFGFAVENTLSSDVSTAASDFDAFGSDTAVGLSAKEAKAPHAIDSTTTVSFNDVIQPTADAQESSDCFYQSNSSSFHDSGIQSAPEVFSVTDVKSPFTDDVSASEPFDTPKLASETQKSDPNVGTASSFSIVGPVKSSEETTLTASTAQESSANLSDVKFDSSAQSADVFGDFEFSSPPHPSMATEEQMDAIATTFSPTHVQSFNEASSRSDGFKSVTNSAEVDGVAITVETATSDGTQQFSSESTKSAAASENEAVAIVAPTSFSDFGSFDTSSATSMAPIESFGPVEPVLFGSVAAPSAAPAPTITDLSSDFGFFGDSRTNSQSDTVPTFDDFASFESHVQAPGNDQESFGLFSESRSASINLSSAAFVASFAESNDAIQDLSVSVESATRTDVMPEKYSSVDSFQDTRVSSNEYSMHEVSMVDSFDSFHAIPSESLIKEASSMESFDQVPTPLVAAAPSESAVAGISSSHSFQAFSAPVTVSALSTEFSTMSMTETDELAFNSGNSNGSQAIITNELSVSHAIEPMEESPSTEQENFEAFDSTQAGAFEGTVNFAESDTFGSFESHGQASESETAIADSGSQPVADLELFSAFGHSPNVPAKEEPESSAFDSFRSHAAHPEHTTTTAVNSRSEIAPDFDIFDDFNQHSEAPAATKADEFSFKSNLPNESGGYSVQTQSVELDALPSADATSIVFGSDSAAQFESFESVARTDDFTDFSEGGFANESAARSDGESDGNFVLVSDPGSSCEDGDAFGDGSPSSEDCDFHGDNVEKAIAGISEELEISASSFPTDNAADTTIASDPFSSSDQEPVEATSTVVMNDEEFEQMLEMTPSASGDYLNKSAEDVARDTDDLLSDGEQTDAAADASKTYTMEQVDSELDAALSSAAPVV